MPRIKDALPEEYRRSRLIWGLVYIVILALALGTAWIHLNPDKRIVRQSQKQYWANVAVSATRGSIEDRNGVPLAVSVSATSYFIDPKYWDPANAAKLIPIFGKKAAQKFASPIGGRFHWVVRNVPVDKAQRARAANIPGLYSMNEKMRVYPHGQLAFHVLGFCDIDDYGQAGVELAWNNVLFSPPRTRFLTKDSKGGVDDISGRAGIVKDMCGSIKLTLDSQIQQILELRLSEGAKSAGAAWGAAVCVDPRTGEVLALASYPTLDPNDRRNLMKNREAVRNNVVGRVFEPGSIFKPITMSIALDSASATKNSHYLCKGTMRLADKTMSDVNKHAHGMQDLTHVLMNSCNIGMSMLSVGVPKNRAYGMLKQFGFGGKSEIEMSGEESGLVKSPEEWLGTVPANIFIGQGIAVTPIQVLMAIASIANGGSLLKPYIIDEVRDSNGKILVPGQPSL